VEVLTMNELPPSLTVQAALVWSATKNTKACLEVSTPPLCNLGLLAVSCIIAKYRDPDDRTIRDKWGTFEVLDDGAVCPKGKKRDTAAINYEYRDAEREILDGLVAGSFPGYIIGADNVMREIPPAVWLEREFEDEPGEKGQIRIVAATAGLDPLRHIRFDMIEFFGGRPPVSDQELSSKVPKSERHEAAEESLSARAAVLQSKPIAGAYQRKRGPRSHKREAVEASMTKAIREGFLTADSLRNMFEKELAFSYGVSRDTARKARNNVLGQLGL